jgi:hypothetical protein
MQATAQRAQLNGKSVIALLSAIAALALCAFQFGDRYGLNSMPFAQVRDLVSDLAKTQKMAKQGNVELLAGETITGRAVSLRGEVTDANCYLGSHTHAYDHAFCAKLCAAAGSPLLFVSDQGGQVYLVLTERNTVRLPEEVLDRIGIPGVMIKGKAFEADGLRALAVEGFAQ